MCYNVASSTDFSETDCDIGLTKLLWWAVWSRVTHGCAYFTSPLALTLTGHKPCVYGEQSEHQSSQTSNDCNYCTYSSLTDYHWHSLSKKSCWEKWLVSLRPSDEIIFVFGAMSPKHTHSNKCVWKTLQHRVKLTIALWTYSRKNPMWLLSPYVTVVLDLLFTVNV